MSFLIYLVDIDYIDTYHWLAKQCSLHKSLGLFNRTIALVIQVVMQVPTTVVASDGGRGLGLLPLDREKRLEL